MFESAKKFWTIATANYRSSELAYRSVWINRLGLSFGACVFCAMHGEINHLDPMFSTIAPLIAFSFANGVTAINCRMRSNLAKLLSEWVINVGAFAAYTINTNHYAKTNGWSMNDDGSRRINDEGFNNLIGQIFIFLGCTVPAMLFIGYAYFNHKRFAKIYEDVKPEVDYVKAQLQGGVEAQDDVAVAQIKIGLSDQAALDAVVRQLPSNDGQVVVVEYFRDQIVEDLTVPIGIDNGAVGTYLREAVDRVQKRIRDYLDRVVAAGPQAATGSGAVPEEITRVTRSIKSNGRSYDDHVMQYNPSGKHDETKLVLWSLKVEPSRRAGAGDIESLLR